MTLRFAVLLLAVLVSTPLVAQQYPNRPVRMLIPFTSGSAADIIARAMEPQLRERLGQPIVMDNRGGAGGGESGRAEALPDVPTMKEAGYAGLEATNWAGYVVPAATPPASIARLNSELVRILRMPDIQEKLRAQGMFPASGTPEQFAALLQSESTRYSKVVREAGIRAE